MNRKAASQRSSSVCETLDTIAFEFRLHSVHVTRSLFKPGQMQFHCVFNANVFLNTSLSSFLIYFLVAFFSFFFIILSSKSGNVLNILKRFTRAKPPFSIGVWFVLETEGRNNLDHWKNQLTFLNIYTKISQLYTFTVLCWLLLNLIVSENLSMLIELMTLS